MVLSYATPQRKTALRVTLNAWWCKWPQCNSGVKPRFEPAEWPLVAGNVPVLLPGAQRDVHRLASSMDHYARLPIQGLDLGRILGEHWAHAKPGKDSGENKQTS